ncbi:MAG: Lrp/AsnC family transcriptional regulator [Clostridiaceae bacterium]|jgi:DNA-binding Lrp family transcriptional regulator|nr:Lrp/AsnC family transcriptional regulator [Clostridiaceae bacterium]
MQQEILEILRTNSRISDEELAVMLGTDVDSVKAVIKDMEEKGIITGYKTLIDWEKADQSVVTAFIEVRVTPQRGRGFDKVAERIYQYPQVKACSLISGGFDLFVVVEGKTMKEVALFVAEKLATIESVLSTSTHFVLKNYKDNGIIFDRNGRDEREAVVL